MKKLLIVDGNSILNRAFYGIRTLNNSKGLPTNAVYGMITMLCRQLEKYEPDYAAIAFDIHAPTFRHKAFEGYKATRKGMPEELAVQMPYAKKAAEALGFTIVEKSGYEADDILGTLSVKALKSDNEITTYIMTGDRDSLQLVNESTIVLLATNTDYVHFDRSAFNEKYGVAPEQFVDVKAIMGDSSDNIPGVNGIGEKGALSLISQFGSLDSIYSNYKSADLKPSVVKKLEAGKESAYMSQFLARINCDVPDISEINELKYLGIDREKAYTLFSELEFTALIKKMELNIPVSSKNPTDNYTIAESIYNKCELINIISNPNAFVYLEDNNLFGYNGTIARHSELDDECARTLAENAHQIVCYDSKSIYEFCDKYGIKIRNFQDDIMLAAYVLDSQGGHDLNRLVSKYLGDTISDNTSKACYVYRLFQVFSSKLNEGNSYILYRNIELPLAGVLADMEEAGFLIDKQGIQNYGEVLKAQADDLAQRIYFLAGQEFNINSPKQLGEILFEKLKLPNGKKTKTGYSTNAEILQKLISKHPIVSEILDYRQLTKLISTYIIGLTKVADKDGRIHTNFKQTGTATGRLSSAEPNLQNIPVRTEAGRELRKYFLPKKGYKLIAADYSQIELRLLACISGDTNMINAFAEGKDIHASTASAVFGVPIEEVTDLLRKRAKAVNFGIVYGIGEYSLSQDLDISVKQAKEYIDGYLASYPGVSNYLKNIIAEATDKGYVETMYGRIRYIPEIQSQNGVMRKFGERVAMNSPIQGSAADIIKIAMIAVTNKLKAAGLDARLILQVHDELIIEARDNCVADAAKILKEEMENSIELPVPLIVDLSIADRWYET